MTKHFGLILTQKIDNTPLKTLTNYYHCVNRCLQHIKDESHERFLTLLEAVLHAFLYKQLNKTQYSHQFKESDLKEFLNIALELSSTCDLKHQSCLRIIQHLLFKLENNAITKPTKIKYLFERVNNLDDNLCEKNDPASIIQDEWLNEYIFHMPQDWSMLSEYDYQVLNKIHSNNRWSIYIWSKLISLSLSKTEVDKWKETLAELNEWMIIVKHDIYDPNDTLTIIFVKNIFDIVISKHTKSLLSVWNIGTILNYILCGRQSNHNLLNTKQVDDFIQNVHHSMQDILSLNSKLDLSKLFIKKL
ncbi:unnamed protein product [Rotaria sp. Silwood2]|nr:unnamed protein product [Rotaria sp. Silwood2]CAF2869480.1 unnamed protein product [Rotaria sp. Silwood2]CAF4403287.1 unnamed protein product [Rotaria sp. Silwood2]CAF4444685.1 unnamed protein product [Rotaria sp. Silwood2]CAF4477600.1 unnamed protein product [Rotaria sp. Silwood2]